MEIDKEIIFDCTIKNIISGRLIKEVRITEKIYV